MSNEEVERKMNNTKKSIVIQTVISFCLILLLVVLICFQFSQIWKLRNDQKVLNSQLQSLKNEVVEYSDLMDYYSSDEYLEDLARAQDKHKPGISYYDDYKSE